MSDNNSELKHLAQQIINKDKWWDILSRFIDVLRINIFIVDHTGIVILPPEESKYGGKLLVDRSLKFDLIEDSINILKGFKAQGKYFESQNRYSLYCYAIPIRTNGSDVFAYMIVGPVILNRREENDDYLKSAHEYGAHGADLVGIINEIRVLSNVMMNSILDLLAEIVRDNVELCKKECELNRIKHDQKSKTISQEVNDVVNEIRLDELLVTLLDTALKMTNTECGSVMVIDSKRQELSIKASRGLPADRVGDANIKLGEGIAGLAAQENQFFEIKGVEGDNKIQHLLKRSEIVHSLVMPLVAKNRVFGVLNLHTKKEGSRISENVENLRYLSKLVSSAV